MHSPFVFDFVNNLLRDTTPYYAFKPIEKIRNSLLKDRRTIQVTDFGSGSTQRSEYPTKISELAARQLLPAKYGQLLFRLVNRFQPATILELGTSLGVTSLYLAAANTKSKVVTLEGSGETIAIAEEIFERFNARSIGTRAGEFSSTLLPSLEELTRLDFLFVDGNHRYGPTLDYFQTALPFCHDGSVMVFDDIHWSRDMEQAWEEIRRHGNVTLSIDLFRLGILFFQPGRRQEHFTLKF
ncbi:MAG: O-methyltransferase [Bacteroidota bacterium]